MPKLKPALYFHHAIGQSLPKWGSYCFSLLSSACTDNVGAHATRGWYSF